jgi:galactose oxidase-like protein
MARMKRPPIENALLAALVALLSGSGARTVSASADGAWKLLFDGDHAPYVAHGAAIYDAARSRLLVIGPGYYNGSETEVHSLSAGRWERLDTPGPRPPMFRGFSVVLDPLADRLLMFGGEKAFNLTNEVWALPLSGTPAWTRIEPAGFLPVARKAHAAIFDPTRNRMIVYGGIVHPNNTTGDAWSLSFDSGPAWTQLYLAGTPPPPRYSYNPLAAYDPVGDRLVLFGGRRTNPPMGTDETFDDTWSLAFSTETWSPLAVASPGPPPSAAGPLLVDEAGGRLVLFGAGSSTDVWSFPLGGSSGWVQLPGGPAPLPDWRGLVAAIDPSARKLLTFGGFPSYFDQGRGTATWAFDLAQGSGWSRAHPPEPVLSPADRSSHALVWDSQRERPILLGGAKRAYDRSAWAYREAGTPGWEPLAHDGPEPPFAFPGAAIYDPLRDRVVVYGGHSDEVWALSLGDDAAWTPLAPVGTPPAARQRHTAIHDPVGDRMIVYGGERPPVVDCMDTYDEVWALSLAEPMRWTLLASGAGPSRARHSAIYDATGHRMIVVGGMHHACPVPQGNGAETWTFDLATGEWSQLFPMEPPWERFYELGPVVFDAARDRILLFGPSQVFARPAAGGGVWTALNPAGVAPPRSAAILDPVRDRILVAQTGGTSAAAGDQLWALELGGSALVRNDRGLGPSPVRPPSADAPLSAQPEVERARRVTSGAGRSVAVTFSLSDQRPVSLRLYDLAGRCLASREVGDLGAGRHTVELIAERDLPAGVVFVQLAGKAGRRGAKVAIVH